MSAPAGVVDGLLAGRYRLTSRLAAGAMGEVWRARDLLLDREVAVKTLRPEIADDDDARERFRTEARSTGRLSHPGIAAVYDTGESDGRAWLVLELVEGESLQSLLRRSGRLSPEQTLDVVAQTAAALQAAHASGVVHRDIKPGNLLVRPDGAVKVTDFGIASVAGTARLTRTGQVVGTAAYLSPEQAAGGPATEASDLYALGVVAYECLSGAVPFAYDNPVAVLLAHSRTDPPPLPADVPAPLTGLVRALLAKDPHERPAPASEVVRRATAVRAALSGPAARPATGAVPGAPAGATTAVLGTAPLPPTPGGETAGAPRGPADPADRPSSRVPRRLPAPGRPVSRARPERRSPGAARAGLAGRLGQRRAVRVTALLLGLLAVALGLRESSGGAVPSPAPSSATTTPSSSRSPAAGADGGGGAVVPAPAGQQPGQQPPQTREQQPAPPGAGDGGGGGQGEQADDAAEKAAEKAAEDAAERAERIREQGDSGKDESDKDESDKDESDKDDGGKGGGGKGDDEKGNGGKGKDG